MAARATSIAMQRTRIARQADFATGGLRDDALSPSCEARHAVDSIVARGGKRSGPADITCVSREGASEHGDRNLRVTALAS